MRVMLRPYQAEAVDSLRDSWRAKNRRILLQLPTGAGKTICATEIIKGAVAKGNPVLFVAHRRELISQASAKLRDLGIPHGIILAGVRPTPEELVQVGSVQTIAARAFKSGRLELPPAGVVIFDEAHHAIAASWKQIADAYPNAAILGLTATPVRGDGKGLGHLFSDMVIGPSIPELTEQGYLVPVRYFAPSMPDLHGVKLTAGDYNQAQLEGRMDKPKLVGDVVTNWGEVCPDRKTVVFATSVKHSIHLAEQFQAVGINALHLDGETPLDERANILADLRDGLIQVITNCMVLTEGWDQPDVSCCVLARPTKSLGLYLQMAGRVLRPAPDKTDTILIDHSGAVYQHGFLHEPFEWSLDEAGKLGDRESQRKASEPKPITCEKCYTIYEKQHMCPSCGHMPEKFGRGVQQVEGTLGEVSVKSRAVRKDFSDPEKRQWFQMLKYQQQSKGYKPGWTSVQYKTKFGEYPPKDYSDLHPVYPSLEVARYIRHRQIVYAKSRPKDPGPLFGEAA